MRPDGRYRKRRLRNETHIHCHRRALRRGQEHDRPQKRGKIRFYLCRYRRYLPHGLAAYRRGIASKDSAAVIAMLPELHIELRHGADGLQRMFLDGEDVSDAIRMPEISIYASDVSAVPEVRAFLMEMQRSFARTQNVIMDGRDIGTVVLPDAGLKIFLTASVEARAKRRQLELEKKGKNLPFEEVLRDMEYRDKNDSSRAAAPLRPAEDAVRLDTTQLDFDESCAAVESLNRERFAL